MKLLLIIFLKIYHLISKTLYMLLPSPPQGHCCRFEPSCSVYALHAVEQHGVFKGICFSVKRIFKCHPLGPHGYDPVPPRDY